MRITANIRLPGTDLPMKGSLSEDVLWVVWRNTRFPISDQEGHVHTSVFQDLRERKYARHDRWR